VDTEEVELDVTLDEGADLETEVEVYVPTVLVMLDEVRTDVLELTDVVGV